MVKTQLLGQLGEKLAADFLVDKGYQILAQNYFAGKCEIDIIAIKDNVLAVVEVKTRSRMCYGRPENFVKPAQIKSMIRAINCYVERENLDANIRFDIIAVEKTPRQVFLEHIEDAFNHF